MMKKRVLLLVAFCCLTFTMYSCNSVEEERADVVEQAEETVKETEEPAEEAQELEEEMQEYNEEVTGDTGTTAVIE